MLLVRLDPVDVGCVSVADVEVCPGGKEGEWVGGE